MSRSQNLRHNVINQVIEDMARGNIPSPLPSQSGLAEMYNISRTTVRHILQHLSACGVLTLVGKNYGRCEQVPDMRSSYSSGAHPRGTS